MNRATLALLLAVVTIGCPPRPKPSPQSPSAPAKDTPKLSPGDELKALTEKGFTFLREETFSSGGEQHTVKIFRCEVFARALGLSAKETRPACEFVLVPGGSFAMGSPEEEEALFDALGCAWDSKLMYCERERPVHEVEVRRFLLARTEIPSRIWNAVMQLPPESGVEELKPVKGVSWKSVQHFMQVAGGLRLPSEAEWEYACRAGTKTPYAFGQRITTDQVAFDGTWQGFRGPMAVGSLKPNAFGIFDMHGNVSEWCADTWHNTYQGAPSSGWPGRLDDGQTYVIRGGAFGDEAALCRSAFRIRLDDAHSQLVEIGFRPALSVGTPDASAPETVPVRATHGLERKLAEEGARRRRLLNPRIEGLLDELAKQVEQGSVTPSLAKNYSEIIKCFSDYSASTRWSVRRDTNLDAWRSRLGETVGDLSHDLIRRDYTERSKELLSALVAAIKQEDYHTFAVRYEESTELREEMSAQSFEDDPPPMQSQAETFFLRIFALKKRAERDRAKSRAIEPSEDRSR